MMNMDDDASQGQQIHYLKPSLSTILYAYRVGSAFIKTRKSGEEGTKRVPKKQQETTRVTKSNLNKQHDQTGEPG